MRRSAEFACCQSLTRQEYVVSYLVDATTFLPHGSHTNAHVLPLQHVLKGWEDTGLLTECYDADGTKTGYGPLNPTLNETCVSHPPAVKEQF